MSSGWGWNVLANDLELNTNSIAPPVKFFKNSMENIPNAVYASVKDDGGISGKLFYYPVPSAARVGFI